MRIASPLAALLIAPLMVPLIGTFAGCQTHTTVTRSGPPRVQGRATIVEVNARLGMAVVDMKGRQFNVYWKPEITVAHTGAVASPQTMFDPPVGVYNQTTEYPTAFPGQVGDTIDFLGIRENATDILLQRVAVVASAR